MLLVDDFAVILVPKGFFPELSFYLFANGAHELILDRALAKNIIGGNAGLTAV